MTWPDSNQSNKALESSPSASTKVIREDDTEALIRHYFSLNLDLGSLYQQWSKVDPNFRKKAPTFTGVRILNQDAWEALIAFICSSNNNISRISQMVKPANFQDNLYQQSLTINRSINFVSTMANSLDVSRRKIGMISQHPRP